MGNSALNTSENLRNINNINTEFFGHAANLVSLINKYEKGGYVSKHDEWKTRIIAYVDKAVLPPEALDSVGLTIEEANALREIYREEYETNYKNITVQLEYLESCGILKNQVVEYSNPYDIPEPENGWDYLTPQPGQWRE